MIHDPTKRTSLPTAFAPAPLAEMIMLSDLWSPIAEIKSTIGRLAATGSLGHIVQIVDPAEETFPYAGRVEFVEPEGAGSITTGRAENWRADYTAKVENHRAAIRAETDRLGWSFTIHRTDRPVTELLLKLHQRLAGERARHRTSVPCRRSIGATYMIAGLPLAFAEPLILLGLLSLPILWWLLRLVPPRPRRIEFPPTRILFDIPPKEETPAHTPWWLTLLRLALATLVIIAAAGPLWNPPVATTSSRAPLLLLIDDGFAAASTWDARLRTVEDLIARAEADGRGIAVVPLSVTARDISLETPGAARARMRLVKPKPHVDRAQRSHSVAGAIPDRDAGRRDRLAVRRRRCRACRRLRAGAGPNCGEAHHHGGGRRRAARPARWRPPITRPACSASRCSASVSGGDDAGAVRALDLKGLPLGEAAFSFKPGELEAEAQLDLPVEIRNDVARLEIDGERSAGAVQLLDKRWRRRTVGVVTGSTADTAQPLLAATFYLSRALGPFADIRLADRASPGEAVSQFIEQRLPMIVLGRCRQRRGRRP